MPASPPDPPATTLPFAHALVIDDHPLFCDALVLTLRGQAGVRRVDTASTLSTALERIAAGPAPDIVLLDLNLPDVEGLNGLIRLRAAAPESPVLVVSAMSEPRLVGAALAAGAVGFLPKHSGRDALATALARLAAGDLHLPEGYTTPDPDDPVAEAAKRLAQLTHQQRRILELLCQGKLNKQIAWELDIAETTVKAHLTAIMRKLGVQSRTQAVLIAQRARFPALRPDA